MIRKLTDCTGVVVANNIIDLLDVSRETKNGRLIRSFPVSMLNLYSGCDVKLRRDDPCRVWVTVYRGLRVRMEARLVSADAVSALRRLWACPRNGWERGQVTNDYVVLSRRVDWCVKGG